MFKTQDYGIRDRLAMTLLIVLLLASAQTTAVNAEDDIGEAAIDAVYDQSPIDPAVTAPVMTEPIAAEPVTAVASAAAPLAAEPIAAAPIAAAPVAAAPIAAEPVAAAPVAEPTMAQPTSAAAPADAVSGISGAGVNGGSALNQTNVSLSADGGTAVADASGGDDSIAGGTGSGDVAAGNGGRAESDASGGAILVGNINSGNNTGNVIAVGSTSAPAAGGGERSFKPSQTGKVQKPAATLPKPAATGISRPTAPGRVTVRGGRTMRVIARRARSARVAPRRTRAERVAARRARMVVGAVPSTGTGTSSAAIAGTQTGTLFILIGGIAAVGAASFGQALVQRRFARRPVAAGRAPR